MNGFWHIDGKMEVEDRLMERTVSISETYLLAQHVSILIMLFLVSLQFVLSRFHCELSSLCVRLK